MNSRPNEISECGLSGRSEKLGLKESSACSQASRKKREVMDPWKRQNPPFFEGMHWRSAHGARPISFLFAMSPSRGYSRPPIVQLFANGGYESGGSTGSSLSSSRRGTNLPGKFALGFVALRTFVLIAVYYVFSIGLTFYQKNLIRDFPFPLSVVVCHVVIKFLLAACARSLLNCAPFGCLKRSRPCRRSCWCCNISSSCRKGSVGTTAVSLGSSNADQVIEPVGKVVLGWGLYCRAVAVTAISSAFDIGFSNWSFEYITVTLYTMTKSTAIVFILLFSICLGLERPKASLAVIVVCISGGLVLFNYASTQFHLFGFLLVLGASFLSGVRWSYAQLIMQSKSSLGLENPVDMVYHVQPWMLVALLPFSAYVEGKELATSAQAFAATTEVAMVTLGSVVIGAVLAFAMELSEYLLVLKTSSLTLSISGVLKEILTLMLDFRINKSRFSVLNVAGLVMCFAGIIFHLVVKARDMGKVKKVEPVEVSKKWAKKKLNEEAFLLEPLTQKSSSSFPETETEDEVELLDRTKDADGSFKDF